MLWSQYIDSAYINACMYLSRININCDTRLFQQSNKPKNKKGKGKLYVTKNDDMYSNYDDYNDMDDFI